MDFDIIRPYLSRIIAALVVGVFWVIERHFVTIHLDRDIADPIAEVVVFLIYGFVHKATDSRINPVDAARIKTAKDHSDNPV